MHIKGVTIEGFKSYAQRVHVSDFDPKFNAITGLNGSGKSNLLDAICFVLGISNLSQVRAESLLDLVYKKGQAGVTQATVCVAFDNTNKQLSPLGYEEKDTITVTRQIVVGGRNRYRINGRQATPTQINEFFRSIHLNVNNPHFLILQGRITQVLNMKPYEILGMLEEVAGTRMYEEKKIDAFRTFEKKIQKLKEFEEVMSNDLKPTLQRLREQRSQWSQFNKAKEQCVELERFCVAFDFATSERKMEKRWEEIESIQQRKLQLENDVRESEKRIREAIDEIKKLEEQMETQYGNQRQQLQNEMNDLAKKLTYEETELQLKVQEQENCTNDLEKSENALKELTERDRGDGLRQAQRDYDRAKAIECEIEVEAREAEREVFLVSSNPNQVSATFLEDKLESCKLKEIRLKPKLLAFQNKCEALEAKRIQIEQQKNQRNAVLNSELSHVQGAIQDTEQKIRELNFDYRRLGDLQQQFSEKEHLLSESKDKLKKVSRALGNSDISFDDPYPNFDRSKIKGRIASLFKIRRGREEVSLALEVGADNKLRHLVVDDADTAKDILERGNLKEKITIVPLDTVRPNTVPESVHNATVEHFGHSVILGKELIDYDPIYDDVMEYAFGQFYIAERDERAKEVAFHPSIKTRCITLDGNDYLPAGLLTSGYRPSKGTLLQSLHILDESKTIIASIKDEMNALYAQIESQKQIMVQYRRYSDDLGFQKAGLASLQNRMHEEEGQFQSAMERIVNDIRTTQRSLEDTKEKLQRIEQRKNELEMSRQNNSGNGSTYFTTLQSRVQELKRQQEEARSITNEAEHALHRTIAMHNNVGEERANLEAHVREAKTTLNQLEREIFGQQQKVAEMKERCQSATMEFERHQSKVQHVLESLDHLKTEKKNHEQRLKQSNHQKRHIANRMEAAQFEAHLQKLAKDFGWISEAKHLFGVPGSEFDWSSKDPKAASTQYQQAKNVVKKMNKRVDPNVNNQFEQAQNEYRQLHTKHKRVMKDRKKIEEAIKDLDSKKAECIRVIWEKVNKEFGSIFATLLPGTDAKLQPPEGMAYTEGLEVKVSLGGIWKHSLSELSGGQRSLLALSLILAILRFKPAPLYILDEVDSALDLSHTQNIGQMIQRFFPQSQFIIVSLKEGMFNNANVLFKTQFTNGVSSCIRTIPERA